MTKINLVGTGRMGHEYAKVFKHLNIDFRPFCRSQASAEAFSAEFDVQTVAGGVENNVDLLGGNPTIVAAPVQNLFATSKFLMESGVKSLLVEKPCGVDSNEINQLEACRQTCAAQIQVAYNRRYFPSVTKAIELIKADGGLRSFSFDFSERAHIVETVGHPPEVLENWFLANSSHVIDLAFFIGGNPQTLSCQTSGSLSWHSRGSYFCGSGQSESGALFSYHSNWVAPGGWSIDLRTDDHRITLLPLEKLNLQKKGSADVVSVGLDSAVPSELKPGLLEMVQDFVNGSVGKLPSLQAQVDSINGVYEAIRSGSEFKS